MVGANPFEVMVVAQSQCFSNLYVAYLRTEQITETNMIDSFPPAFKDYRCAESLMVI